MLLRHGLICLHQLFLDPIELIQLLSLLVPFFPNLPQLLSDLLNLNGHLRIVSPELYILSLHSFLLNLVPPHALLHLLIVLLHEMHLFPELTELHFECLDVVLPLCELLCEMLVLARELLDLVGRAHIQLGHLLLQELYLVVLLLQLVFQQSLLVLVETLRGVGLQTQSCRGWRD